MFKNTGQYLKEKRKKRRLSQAQLADKIGGVHSQFVSNWERELCNPPHDKFGALVKALNLKPFEKKELFDAMVADATEALKEKFKGIL